MKEERVPNKKKGKRFSTKDKIQCVKLIQLHGSVSKVAKMTGITRQTLTKWLETPELKPKYEVSTEVIEKRAQRKIEKDESDFLGEVYKVKENALSRMDTLIKESKSLRDVTNAFAILHQVGAGADPTNPDDVKGMNITQNNFITKIKQLREGGKTKTFKIEPNND